MMKMKSFKTCFKCKSTKPLADFHKTWKMADGHLNKCKMCANADGKAHRHANPEYYREYEKARFQIPARKQAIARCARKRRIEHPLKYQARYAVSNALRDGKLQRQPCEQCGSAAEAHHVDYAQPLLIKWLCRNHHKELHQSILEGAPNEHPN